MYGVIASSYSTQNELLMALEKNANKGELEQGDVSAVDTGWYQRPWGYKRLNSGLLMVIKRNVI